MPNVTQHYLSHLAPVYVWMAGGLQHALESGAADVAAYTPGSGLAVDLGAGFGMHSIPLARAGFDVLAIDTSALLLATLRENAAGLSIATFERDLIDFRSLLPGPAALVVCMGDTLTHLESVEDVARLAREVRACIKPGGRFVATFRDYSNPAVGESRFIPVRSDSSRILTCFLEEAADHMIAHDLLHERNGPVWDLKVSSYKKLRLPPPAVEKMFADVGMTTKIESGPRGMVCLTAGG